MTLTSEHEILKAKILIVDDQKLDVLVLEKILKTAGYSNLRSLTDAREATTIYQQWQPDLVLLDLYMPYHDGFEVMAELNQLKQDAGYTPVLMITTEKSQNVRLRALQSGAKDFLSKPYEGMEVLIRIRNMIEVRLLNKQVRDQNRLLEEKVLERTRELRETRLDVIHRLARTAEYRDNETGIHIIRMSQYSACLGKTAGMSEAQCELLLNASPLHDIGKIGIPDNILLKPGKLDASEWKIMKTHTVLGAELLSGSSSPLMKMAETIAYTHHEKWNGTGYPRGLKGNDIPLVGRICGLCDVFDALTSVRPYKKEWSFETAVSQVQKESAEHFDPQLVKYFLTILPEIKRIKEKHANFNIRFDTD